MRISFLRYIFLVLFFSLNTKKYKYIYIYIDLIISFVFAIISKCTPKFNHITAQLNRVFITQLSLRFRLGPNNKQEREEKSKEDLNLVQQHGGIKDICIALISTYILVFPFFCFTFSFSNFLFFRIIFVLEKNKDKKGQ